MDQHTDVWTPQLVKKALVWALRLAASVAGPTGPRGYGNGMPAVVYTADEIADMAKPDFPSRPLMAAEVTRMEAVLNWQGRYLAGNPDLVGASNVLKVFLRCKATRRPFGKECERRGWARRTADDRIIKATSAIAIGLERDGVSVFFV